MSEQARLLTQGEIGRVNEMLNALSDNLYFHRNGSVAKAHGITLVTSSYYDSGGDKLSSYVIRFSIETTPGNLEVLYAPADAVGTYNTKVPVGGALAPSVLPTSLGITTTSTGPDGSVNSPGIPQLASNLLTRYTETLSQDLEIADQLLKAHALLSHGEKNPAAHYGASALNEDSVDSLGHVMGRSIIKLVLGNQEYKVVCDSNITGPPQGPRITSQPADQTTKGETEPLPTKAFSVTVGGGNSPFTYQWQIAIVIVTSKTDPLLLINSNWQDMVNSTTYNSPLITGCTVKAFAGATLSTFTAQNTAVDTSNSWRGGNPDVPAYIFRCKVTSATGGVSYSNAASFRVYDKTGC